MQAHNSKAALLQSVNRHHDALTTLVKATEINPHDVRTLEGQGLLLTQFKQFEWATHAFRHAISVDPDYPYLEGNLMSASLHNCDWTDFDAARESIFEGIRAGKRVCSPHTIMSLTDDAQLAKRCIEIYAADKIGTSFYNLWQGEVYRHRRKRVAFISGDFRTHPVGYLLIGMIEGLDKRRFEVTGVSTSAPDGSDLWKRYRCAFDHYLNVHDMPSLDVAKLLRAMEIDIAIDLSGHTEGTRLDVLSHRPAPAQVTYLGFPGTLGLPFIDYLIADPRIIPPELQHHYREKILYLPHCYLPRDNSVVPSPITPQRSDFGLPDEGIVFCSFNHDYKINPPMFKVWMDLLKAVPGSVLWLMKLNDGAHVNLSNAAIAHGVDPDRLVYASRLPRVEDHLARYRLADVFLDTFPYNGHTTAGDALLAGLPVVTLCGQSFASRVAYSLLHDVGLPQYATRDLTSYSALALRLANDAAERARVKMHLQKKLQEKAWPPSDSLQAQALMNTLMQIQGAPAP
jgi:predicted O-linked N-acetylglucosamine transferase (SPINDLY family)